MKKLALFSLIALLGISCSKENHFFNEIEISDTNQLTEKSPVEKVNDYLVFKDWEAFQDIMSDLADKTTQEVKTWEADLDFISMRNSFELADEELGAITDEAQIDDFINKYTGKIKFIDEGRDKSIEPLVNISSLLPLLNPKGILMVDQVIHQFLPDGRLIMIGDGDFSKLENAKTMTTSDENNHIFIAKVYEQEENLRKDFNITRYTYDGNNSNRRIKSSLKLASWLSPVYNNGAFTGIFNTGWSLTMQLENQRRRLWWSSNKANLTIFGNFNVSSNVLAGNLSNSGFTHTDNNTSSTSISFGKATGSTNVNLPNSFFPTAVATAYEIRYRSNEVNRTTALVK
jgi:hypothetical protein